MLRERLLKWLFEKGFGLDGREIFSVAHISMKAPVYGGDFPSQVIGWSILTTSGKCSGVVHVNKTHHKKRDTKDSCGNP